jgi:hypothetical protein
MVLFGGAARPVPLALLVLMFAHGAALAPVVLLFIVALFVLGMAVCIVLLLVTPLVEGASIVLVLFSQC